MAAEALHSSLDQIVGLDTHQETADEILSRLDDDAIASLAESGTVEDIRVVVEMLIEDNPELRPYLIEFQQANSAALAAELQRAAANDYAEAQNENEEVPEEEMHELIEQAQSYLYESLDIDENQANNGALTNFAKGVVDTLIFENGDLALQVIETRGGVILDALTQLATWKGIKGVLQALGESIWDLFAGDAYEKGKAVADLGLVATGVGVTAVVGRKAITAAVRQLDTQSPNNLDRTLIDDISKLPDTERLEAAGVFLGKDFIDNPDFETQRQAILDAHNFGERLEDGSYSLGGLREKTRILREAGLTSGEIRTLFDNNICGKEFPEFPNIYEDPRFDYLAEYRDILGEITEADIVGEGVNAITLKHPSRSDRIIKIAKPGDTDNLMNELAMHKQFRDELEELRDIYTSGPEKELLDNFDIPAASNVGNRDGVYEMDWIEGKNMRNIMILDYYKDELSDIPEEALRGLTDHGVEQLIKERGLQLQPLGRTEMDERWMITEDRNFISDTEHAYDSGVGRDIRSILRLFEKEGYNHRDGHWGNFMLGDDGNIYMIDFGRSTITPKNN